MHVEFINYVRGAAAVALAEGTMVFLLLAVRQLRDLKAALTALI